MRLISEEETEADNKLMDEWWAGLGSTQKHNMINSIADLKKIPDRRHLCMEFYRTGKKDEHGTPFLFTCYEPKAPGQMTCKKHNR